MAIANVSLTDTFDYWRTVTNSLVVGLNNKLIYFGTANANTISITQDASLRANVFINVKTTSALTDQSTANIPSAYAVNTVLNYAVTAFGFANGVNANAAAAFGRTNTVYNIVNSAFAQANAFSIIVGNTKPAAVQGSVWWHNELGKLFIYYKDGDTDQWIDTSPAYDVTAIEDLANGSYDAANASYNASNITYTSSNVSFSVANAAYTSGNASYLNANAAFRVANAAYGNANTKLANTTGVTFAGNLNISGNLTLSTAGSNSSITLDGLRVGYLEVPQISKSANYTTVYSDSGKHIIHPSSDDNARTFTIPANSSVPYAPGTVITFINMKNSVTIDITSDELRSHAHGVGSRTLAANGQATCIKVDSTTWLINGVNLS